LAGAVGAEPKPDQATQKEGGDVMAIEPTANPKDIHELDATIQSTLKLALLAKKIDREDALYLLIARLPEWGSREFVMDMVRASFDAANKKSKTDADN
jgi:hypothetical protein